MSPEWKRKIAEALRGRILTAEHRAKVSVGLKGHKVSALSRQKAADRMSARSKTQVGSANPRWIADRTKLRPRDDGRTGAHLYWSCIVRHRDHARCVMADLGGCRGRLESHHIVPYKEDESLRFDVDNGITLCRGHHPFTKTGVVNTADTYRFMVCLTNAAVRLRKTLCK